MIRPNFPENAPQMRVYGTILKEDFDLLFREVLPTWGASRRTVSHLLHILADHVRAKRIHELHSTAERTAAVESILADLAAGGTMGEGRDQDGHSRTA